MSFWKKMKKTLAALLAGVAFWSAAPATAPRSLEEAVGPKAAYAEESVEAMVKEGRKLGMSGKYDEAEKIYLRVIKKDPDNSTAHNELGIVYFKQNRFEEAIKEYKTAIKIEPKKFFAYSSLGTLYRNIGNYKLAIENYQESLKLNPSNFGVYYGLGISYKELGMYKEAIVYFDEYLKHNNDEDVRKLKSECELILSQK